MENNQQDAVIHYLVRRTLGEQVYRIRFLYFKLTVPDLFVCGAIWTLAVNLSDWWGLRQATFFGVSFDPWGWILLTYLTASALSILHHLRPEGHAERIVAGWFAPRYYTPRTRRGDHRWRPSPQRELPRLSATGAIFEQNKDSRRAKKRR